MRQILLIDDEEKLRTLMAKIIGLEGFEVTQAEDANSAQKKLTQKDFDVIICDVKLPDANGVELIKEIKDKQPLSEVILLTAYGNISDGVQAIKNGAFDYLVKGDDNNKIVPLLHKAMDKVQLAKRVYQLEKQVGKRYSFDNIIGKSTGILNAIELGKKVAQTDTSVLLLGETGTGKEVFAQAIHNASKRTNKPFIALNCSAFNRELLETELFGHIAGAFTGAIKDKKGLFEEAHTGTIFLDEIGEMAIELQAKLLRVLEAGEFIKVGTSLPTKVNVRVIAATNRNLEQEIETGHFRSDLFYRLSVFQITLPPLRERISDIELLASNFTQEFALKMNKKIKSLEPDYIKALQQNQWKGNIRELKNIIERSVILSDKDILDTDSLPYELRSIRSQDDKSISAFSMAGVEKLHIQKVLNYTQGNKAETARLLGIGIATLYRKIEEYKIA
ncbi:sigma-54-dependent transcriptional regulator [Albibacterium bauzanense]|uniref:DNA-binding NtrC family response regulator n=1 Tax=Albibacterium bauzanense TaxID=653929 RepID=A0A4R1LPD7_9SPHI|nr:sigma-54 dependent transcriptional regulator [Albibacterium bauzanense]TCK80948.1 DNA-binding NtrC family response regulator [Albibacterium bauzanense]